ncbi:cell envelope integrity protein TolA [Rhodanobacter sp. DHG33]|uniref:cell envelope integrity protein TolA n=1 Tax=Rhodanobacter sp. DHG33 TaxID=2775921 RepID=UPI00177B3F50|nr:cell envelope integrity protein TolA [Rhodanobacter sp. DHG33]MBD8897964.1 cell envelope integrity protein TolA [Rhodanobacter sp. DHG33]
MDDRKGIPRAVALSALLHLGIVAFLFLAVLPCTSYENFINMLGLPAWMNPITCAPPLQLKGPVIEATLIGPTGSPPPKSAKVKPVPNTVPPPPSVPPPPPPPVTQPKVAPLPPPPEHPDVKDQERVVEQGVQQAEEKQLQEEKQRQRQAELDAQAAKKKEELKKVDEMLAQMDAASAQTKKQDTKAKQAKQQFDDLKNAQDDGLPNLPNAAQRQTGNNAQNSDLTSEYAAAIQNAVTPNWSRPDNMPSVPCKVHIVQMIGGDVMSATVDPSCPYDEAGRRSVENAILRTKTLPYKGFESVFQRNLTFTFTPQ